MADDSRTPDANELARQDTAELPFPGTSRPGFRVYFEPEVHEAIQRHAGENTAVEVGGVLVGDWRHDAGGPFVNITRSLRCDAATSKSGEVTFTHEAWNAIHHEMDTRYCDLRIVGWYHTHPSFGIFLSERDTFIHEHFFSGPGQIAYVVDPVAETEGVFAWRKGKPSLLPYYWVGHRILADAEKAAAPAPQASPAQSPEQIAAADRATLASAAALVRLGVICLGLGVICLAAFAIGYQAASLRSAWEQRMIVEGAVAHYGVWKGLRPGLHEDLQKADAALDEVSAVVEKLAKEHVALAGEEAAEKREAWSQVRGALRSTREFLAQTDDRYALSEDERRKVEQMIAARLYGTRERGEANEADKPRRSEPAKDVLPMPAGASAAPEKSEKKSEQDESRAK